MENFIGNNVRFLANWGQFIAGGLIILCVIAIYFLGKNNRYHLPKGFLSIIATVFLLIIITVSSLVFARINKVKPSVMVILNQLESVKGRAVPLSFRLVTDSSQQKIEDYRGKIVLLNFWATWCKPCLTEIPDLNKLQKAYKEKGLEVIAISDETQERLLRFHAKNEMSINSGFVESFDWAQMGSERPVTFLLNKDGVIVEYFTGGYDYDYFESKIRNYLQ